MRYIKPEETDVVEAARKVAASQKKVEKVSPGSHPDYKETLKKEADKSVKDLIKTVERMDQTPQD